tara:strand:+ start:172 stop:606 length:435 start_codon:yes stop_codon:yes gene_type:complete
MPDSSREIDLNPRTYVGLSFPLRADNNNDFRMTKNSLQQSRHNLKNLLLTMPGERVMMPEFGCRLRELIMEQNDKDLPIKIEEVIREAVVKWLPYVNISTVDTLTDDGNENRVFVTVKYATALDADTLQQITLDAGYTSTGGEY